MRRLLLLAWLAFCGIAHAQPVAPPGVGQCAARDGVGRVCAPSRDSLTPGATFLGLFAGPVVGVNYSGMETAYPNPSTADIDYFASRGINLVRLPVSWENLTPTLGGTISAPFVAQIVNLAAYAASKGIALNVDVHNYAQYNGIDVGATGGPTIAQLANMEGQLGAALAGKPGIASIEVMNEPHLGDQGLQAVLQPMMQASVTAIRAAGFPLPLVVDGDNYSSAGSWVSLPENNGFAVYDPLNLIVYTAHAYPDCDSSGSHSNWALQSTAPSQDAQGDACPDSSAVTVDTLAQRYAVFVNWVRSHGYTGYIGESGAPNNSTGTDTLSPLAGDPHWLAALDHGIAYLQSQRFPFTYWAAGTDFVRYFMSAQPQQIGVQTCSITDTPVWAVLEKWGGGVGTYAFCGPRHGTAGVAAAFGLVAHAWLPAATTITFSDGGAGGVFTPASVTLPAGFNGSASFSYTPAGSATYALTASNNGVLSDPPAIGFSTRQDFFADVAAGSGSVPIVALASRALNTAQVTPTITLRRASDGATASFAPLTSTGDVSVAAINAWSGGGTLRLVSETNTAPGQSGGMGTAFAANDSANYGSATELSDEPVWSPTAVAGAYPGVVWSGSRTEIGADITGIPAATVLTVVCGASGARALNFEFTTRWLMPGSGSGWWEFDTESPQSQGTYDGSVCHVLAMRYEGIGTGTGTRDLFVDGVKVASNASSAATTPVQTQGTGLGTVLRFGFFDAYAQFSSATLTDTVVLRGGLSDAEVAEYTTLEQGAFHLAGH